jgi:hypothetical protein
MTQTLKKNLRKNVLANVANTRSTTSQDYTKWITIVISLIGIFAWFSGESFCSGYWESVDMMSPISPYSFQKTAFLGFVAMADNWLKLLGTFLVAGIYIFLLSIQLKVRKSKANDSQGYSPKRKRTNWLIFSYDKRGARLGGTISIVSLTFMSLVLVLVGWHQLAYQSGQKRFTEQVCDLRTQKATTSTIKLADNSTVSGFLFDRSDKLVAIMERYVIQVITIGDHPQIAYSVGISDIDCKNMRR